MYKTNFISPLPIYARVKEELKSYFSTGSVDDLMFSIWTRDCIDKMEYTYLPLREAVLDMYNHKCELPCDFKAVKEVWLTATCHKGPITSPHVFYYQTDCRISPAPAENASCEPCVQGYQCFPPSQTPDPVALPSLCDVPPEYVVTHKVMNQMIFSYTVTGMLKPGNFKTIGRLHDSCPNRDIWSLETFDIIGNNLVTSFSTGSIYMAYYGTHAEVDDQTQYYMIPDNDPFQKYLYHYLRFMVFQQLFDQSTDETFNQIMAKRNDAEDRMNTAYVNAKNYAISDDIYGVQRSIIRSYNRNNRFQLRGPASRGSYYRD